MFCFHKKTGKKLCELQRRNGNDELQYYHVIACPPFNFQTAWLGFGSWPAADPPTFSVLLYWQCFCRFNIILALLLLTLWQQHWALRVGRPHLSFCLSFCCVLPHQPQRWVVCFACIQPEDSIVFGGWVGGRKTLWCVSLLHQNLLGWWQGFDKILWTGMPSIPTWRFSWP